MRSSRNAWGGFFPVFLGGEWGDKKEIEGQGVGLRWSAISLKNATTNGVSDGGRMEKRLCRGGTPGGDNYPSF